ncbi:MAG: T9SS type A sorting domain-containing protein [Bacteroidia bacterium]|nr:T9SS type A sorting domain-containing protein [Bacteroidia bacterium]
MKKCIYLLLLYVCIGRAQVVFCPPGAEWHSLFETRGLFGQGGFSVNEKIKYVRDSVINGTPVKVLQHQFFYYTDCFNSVNVTVIKQSGDTVFFRNSETLHNWQILYNYTASAGQGWTNNLKYSFSSGRTYTITVDSVSTFTLNSMTLRRLYVKYDYVYSHTIDERLGVNGFLFNFRSPSCDGHVYKSNLCYGDNGFAIVQLSALSCNYQNALGNVSNQMHQMVFKFSPNPAQSFCLVQLPETESGKHHQLQLKNSLGQVLLKQDLGSELFYQLPTHQFAPGIYFLSVYTNGEMVGENKLMITK